MMLINFINTKMNIVRKAKNFTKWPLWNYVCPENGMKKKLRIIIRPRRFHRPSHFLLHHLQRRRPLQLALLQYPTGPGWADVRLH